VIRFAAAIARFTCGGALFGATAVRPSEEIFALADGFDGAELGGFSPGAVPPEEAYAPAEAGIATISVAATATAPRSPCGAMNWSSLPSRFRS
jgi:hypothetical protein